MTTTAAHPPRCERCDERFRGGRLDPTFVDGPRLRRVVVLAPSWAVREFRFRVTFALLKDEVVEEER